LLIILLPSISYTAHTVGVTPDKLLSILVILPTGILEVPSALTAPEVLL